jgi:hypothetical protein
LKVQEISGLSIEFVRYGIDAVDFGSMVDRFRPKNPSNGVRDEPTTVVRDCVDLSDEIFGKVNFYRHSATE